MELAEPKEIETLQKSILELENVNGESFGKLPDSEYFATLSDFMLLCKKAGIFPYYTAYAVAVAFESALPAQRNSVMDGVIQEGLKKMISEQMQMQFEAEMVYLIERACRNIREGVFEDEKKVHLMTVAFEEGFLSESLYGGCSQCVVKALLKVMKKDDAQSAFLFKAASSLSGGVAGCNDGACGAYIGANMIISSIFGRELTELNDDESVSYEKSNRIGQRLHDEFIAVYGTVVCCNVHACIFGRQFDFRDEASFDAFKKAGAHEEKCPCVVGLTAALAMEALYDEYFI